MLIIKLKDGEKIDRALKRYKNKYNKTGVMKELRNRQEFVKKSVKRRQQIKKAIYIQKLRDEEQD